MVSIGNIFHGFYFRKPQKGKVQNLLKNCYIYFKYYSLDAYFSVNRVDVLKCLITVNNRLSYIFKRANVQLVFHLTSCLHPCLLSFFLSLFSHLADAFIQSKLFLLNKFNPIQDYLYSAFHDTIVAKQLYRTFLQ